MQPQDSPTGCFCLINRLFTKEMQKWFSEVFCWKHNSLILDCWSPVKHGTQGLKLFLLLEEVPNIIYGDVIMT